MDLLHTKIRTIYFRYLGAAFGSAMISSIYGIADMAMVGQYQGPDGAAALAVVAPVWNLIYSLGLLAGIGGGVLFSVAKGGGEGESNGNEYFTAAFIGTVIFSAVSWIAIVFFDRRMLLLFGAEETLLPLARQYLQPIKFAVPLFVFNQMLAAFLRNDGSPTLATLAVLAGDGLLTAAFETAASAATDPAVTVKAIRILAEQAGELGMVGGQVLDMDAEEQELTEQGIYDIQCRKTGALIQAACQIGVVAAGGTQQQLDAAKTYAQNLGLAFQIRDDMLDVLGDAAKLGKATHVDENKNTFVRLYGIGACSKMIESETKTAIDALGCFENSDFLVEMARQLALREY